MKKSFFNSTHIEGLVYEHSLELRVSGENSKHPGTQFIMGNLNIATDSACTNIIPVHFTYVTAVTSKGKTNTTFGILKDIIDEKVGTVMKVGADKAGKVRIDSAIGLNEFYSDRNGTDELVSVKRNEGGFVHIVNALSPDEKTHNTFEADMVITGVTRTEGDEEKGTKDKVKVRGVIFDFRKAILPIDLSITNEKGMNYFEGLEASPKTPVFIKLWGRQISQTTVTKQIEESAWGETLVKETPTSRRDWVITGSNPEPYLWDDESTITAAELTQAMADRETYLATLKQRRDEYKAQQSVQQPAPAMASNETFQF